MRQKQLFVSAFCLMVPLLAITQPRYAVLIHEIMADPSPSVGLPSTEWIEIWNASPETISLGGWRLRDRQNQSGPFPSYALHPGEWLLIAPSAGSTALSSFGNCLTIPSFPSLDNEGDCISLIEPGGRTIHSVAYDLSSYQNEMKQNGGWTLEMIDSHYPGTGTRNWTASTHALGGTPGAANAVSGSILDTEGPRFLHGYMPDAFTLHLSFSEALDSASVEDLTHYQSPPGLLIQSIRSLPPLFDRIELVWRDSIPVDRVLELTVSHIRDVGGILLAPGTHCRGGRPVKPRPGEILINELLFYPRVGGSDFVELFNPGPHLFDGRELFLSQGSHPVALPPEPRLLFPGEYWVLTTDSLNLIREYFVKDPLSIRQMKSFPTLPTDKGRVILLHRDGMGLDTVDYADQWHSPFLTDTRGVSLERLDPKGPSMEKSNWHSAASTVEYATPGYQNSQQLSTGSGSADFRVNPSQISPDNDGFQDVAVLTYQSTRPGASVHIQIYDVTGHLIRYLVNRGWAGVAGRWVWDGTNDQGQAVANGVYMIKALFLFTEGGKRAYKQLVSLVNAK